MVLNYPKPTNPPHTSGICEGWCSFISDARINDQLDLSRTRWISWDETKTQLRPTILERRTA